MKLEKKKYHLIEAIMRVEDEKLLNLVEDILEEYTSKGYVLSEEQIKELEERERKHLAGESKSFTWEEVETEIKRKFSK